MQQKDPRADRARVKNVRERGNGEGTQNKERDRSSK